MLKYTVVRDPAGKVCDVDEDTRARIRYLHDKYSYELGIGRGRGVVLRGSVTALPLLRERDV